jgi:hypothetical protein
LVDTRIAKLAAREIFKGVHGAKRFTIDWDLDKDIGLIKIVGDEKAVVLKMDNRKELQHLMNAMIVYNLETVISNRLGFDLSKFCHLCGSKITFNYLFNIRYCSNPACGYFEEGES